MSGPSLKGQRRRSIIYCPDLRKAWDSTTDAGEAFDISPSQISLACRRGWIYKGDGTDTKYELINCGHTHEIVPFRCEETGEEWLTLGACSLHMDINPAEIWLALNGALECAGGKHFAYMDDGGIYSGMLEPFPEGQKRAYKPKSVYTDNKSRNVRIPVLEPSSGLKWDSTNDLASELGVDRKSLIGLILKGYRINNRTFVLQEPVPFSNCKKVKCLETGKVFNSIRECAEESYISVESLRRHLKGAEYHKTCGGLHYIYAN